jgi:hypothetical protein
VRFTGTVFGPQAKNINTSYEKIVTTMTVIKHPVVGDISCHDSGTDHVSRLLMPMIAAPMIAAPWPERPLRVSEETWLGMEVLNVNIWLWINTYTYHF